MKLLVSVILVSLALAGNNLKSFEGPPAGTENLATGFIQGIGIGTGSETCIKNTNKIVENLQNAFKKFEYSNEKVAQALKKINDAFSQVPKDIVKCNPSQSTDAVRMAEAIAVFKEPTQHGLIVADDVIINGVLIKQYLETSRNALTALDFLTAGTQLGMMFKNFVPKIDDIKAKNGFIMIQNIISTLGFYPGSEQAVSSQAKILTDAESAISTLDLILYDSVSTSLKKISSAFEKLPKDLSKFSKALESDSKRLESSLKTLKDHVVNKLEVSDSDVLLKGVSIKSDLQNIVNAFMNLDYVTLGQSFGSLFGKFLSGDNKKDEFQPLYDGFIKSIGLSDIASLCLKDSQKVYNNLKSVLLNLDWSTAKKLTPSLNKIQVAFNQVSRQLKACKKGFDLDAKRIDAALYYFRYPAKYGLNVTVDDVVLNKISIKTDLSTLKASTTPLETGTNAGALIAKFLPLSNLKGLNFNQVMDIIGGFFVGMGTDVNTPDLAPCVTNSAEFGGWIERSVVDFSKHTFDGTKDGFMDLSNAFAALPSFVQKCVPASVEVATVVEKAVMAWAHPLSLLYHVGLNIIFNGAEIFADISKAMGDYQSGNWYGFGFDIGQSAFKIIYVPSKEMEQLEDDEVLLFTQGFVQGLGLDYKVEKEIPDFSGELIEALALLKEKNFYQAKDALTKIASVYLDIASVLESQCAIDMLNKVAEELVEPTNFVYVHEKGMMVNGRSMGKELHLAFIDYQMKDYANAGFYFAKAAKNLV